MNLTIPRQFYKILIFPLIIFLIGVGFSGIVFGKELKIGFIDMERLHAGLFYYQELEDAMKAKNVELDSFRGDLYKEYLQFYQEHEQKYNREKEDKSPGEQTEIAEHFQAEIKAKMDELNIQLEKKKQEIETYNADQNQFLIDKVAKLITDISKKEKYTAVIDKKLVLYGGTDITNNIIKKAEKDHKNKTVKN
jgi:Skp family chaperone for outer membrane proteins